MDLREIEWKDMAWIHLAQERDQRLAVVNVATNLRIP
jgi:hypothetical protein